MEGEFANGRLDALLGYSERLNAVLDKKPEFNLEEMFIEAAPIGGGKSTFLFTDALVMSAKCQTDRCIDAAKRFAEFYISDDVMISAMMGKDTKDGHPRYLLSATQNSFESPEIKADPIYSQLRLMLNSALPYPNQGVPEARESGKLKPLVRKLIHTPR